MKKDDSEYKRLVRIIVVLAVILSITLAAAIFWASFEISGIKRSISDRTVASAQLSESDMAKLSGEISKLIVIPAPIKGDKGDTPPPAKDGRDGNDSVSTHTIVEKPIIIEKPVPGKDGKDGEDRKPIRLGISQNGNPIWRYEQDREWQLFEFVEVDL